MHETRATMVRRQVDSAEDFRFSLEDWALQYGLHVNRHRTIVEHLGLCWETHGLDLCGPLCSRTRRKIERVKLSVNPGGRDPTQWKEEWTNFGAVHSVGNRTLCAVVWIPTASFHSLMLALVGNRVAGASIAVTFTGRGAGGVHDFTVARSKSELEPAGE